MSRRRPPNVGDTITVFDDFYEVDRVGVVVDILSTQFTYQPDHGSLRFCPLNTDWKVTEKAVCESTPEPDEPSLNGAEKAHLSDCVALTSSDQEIFEGAIRKTLGLPPTPGPSFDLSYSSEPLDDE